MRNLHNTLISLLRSGKCYTPFSALALASLLVCMSVTAFSDVIPVPTGPFSDSSVITNLTFASVEDVLAFQSEVNDLVYNIDGEIYMITNGTARIDAAAAQIYDKCNLILQDEGGVTGEQRDYINYIKAQTTTGYSSYNSNIPRNTRNINNAVSSIASDVDTVSSAVDSIALYNANYATATFDSGSGGESGGCSCPDYTTMLQNLLTALQAIQQNVSGIASTAGSMLTELTAIRVSQELTSAEVLSILDYLTGSLFNGYFEDMTDYLSVIEDDTSQLYIFWTQTFWQKFLDLYTQIDMLRADVELYGDAITNRMFSPPTIFWYDHWLRDSRGGVGLAYSPLNFFGSFFGGAPSDINGGWGDLGSSFRDFFEYEYITPLLVALGIYPTDYLYDQDSASVFIEPLHGVTSNLWETARPDGVVSRGLLYDLWAEGLDDDANIPGMPTGREVSQQPMADAMIGLLYRIQYLLSMGYRPADSNVVSDVISDVPPDAKRAATQLLSLEFISPATTNIPFLRVYGAMKTALQRFKDKYDNIKIADTWLVLGENGFTMEFTGSNGDPLTTGTDKPIYLTQPDFEGSNSDWFYGVVSDFMGAVWYGIYGLVALVVTGFVFRFFWIATTFTIAVIGGDFSEAVEQFGNIGKSLTGGGD